MLGGGGAKHVGGCTNEVGGVRTPPENPPVYAVDIQHKVTCCHMKDVYARKSKDI